MFSRDAYDTKCMLYQYDAFQLTEHTWISSSTTVNIFVYMHSNMTQSFHLPWKKLLQNPPLTKTSLMSRNLRFAGISGMKQAKECSVIY